MLTKFKGSLHQKDLCRRIIPKWIRTKSIEEDSVVEFEVDLEDEEEEDAVEAGESVCKIRGGVRWSHHDGHHSDVVFEEWGKTPWLESLDQYQAEDEEE